MYKSTCVEGGVNAGLLQNARNGALNNSACFFGERGRYFPFSESRSLFSCAERERRSPVVAILIACYLIAALTHLYLLFTGRLSGIIYGMGALLLGFSLHTLMLGMGFSTAAPQGWGPWLSGMAWVIVLMYLIVYARYRDIALGGFAVPAAFVLEGYASAFPGAWGAGSLVVQGYMLKGHAVLALLSSAAFFLLSASALMYLVQSQQLKSRRPSAWLHRLPSLDVLDDLNHKILYFGFAFLTASLLLGSMWAKSRHGAYWSLDPVRTWPLLLIWGAYGLLLVCRLTRSWKGKRSAVFSMLTFAAALLALVAHF